MSKLRPAFLVLCLFQIRRAAAAMLALLIAAPAPAQPVPDSDTLLLLQFDQTADADYALGTPSVDLRATLTDRTGGRFAGGVDVGADDRLVIVGNDGNVHPEEGTIELWIKPHWAGSDESKHGLLSCSMGEREYININCLGKGRLGIAIAAGQGDEWAWRREDGDISDWKPDTWHHVAFAWGNGRLCVFIDGQESDDQPSDAQMPNKAPESLALSGVDGVIDALRISRRMYSADDARRSIQQALNPPYRYATEMPWQATGSVWSGGRELLRDVTIPLIIGTKEYSKGFVCTTGATIELDLGRSDEVFQAAIGVCPLSPNDVACSFEVLGDGKTLFESGPRTTEQAPEEIAVPVDGVSRLRLAVRGEGPRVGSARGIWAGAVLLREPEADVLMASRELKLAVIDMYRRQQNADQFTFEVNTSRRLLITSKSWEDEIDPALIPSPEDAASTLAAFGTPGEYEPVNFVVYAFEDVQRLRVEASDLRCGEFVIPGSRVDVRLVLRRLMRDLYTLPPERSTVLSRFLLANQPVDVPAGTFREYHLIIQVPANAAPGQYAGTVRLVEEGEETVELPLAFEVLPFKLLPLEEKAHGVYYRLPGVDQDWTAIEAELADIRAHGGTMLKSNLGIDHEMVDEVVSPSYDRLRRGLALLRKHGFRGPLPVSTGCEHAARLHGYDPVNDQGDQQARERFSGTVKTAMEGLIELSKEYPEFELMPTHMDEIFGRDRLDRYIRFTEAVRQVPSLRVYITLHNDPKRDVTDMMRQCDPYVDVRCYNGHCMDNWIHAGHTFDELSRDLAASGDEAWIYHNIRGSFYMAEWTRLVNGYYLWISPLRVHVPWMYYSFKGSPFDATDGPRLRGGDFAYAAPDPDDPKRMVPTRHWEAFREGIDDLRYLTTLETLAERRRGTPASDAALGWLAELRQAITPKPEELEPIEKESPILVLWSRKLDGAAYRRIRREAAKHIIALTR